MISHRHMLIIVAFFSFAGQIDSTVTAQSNPSYAPPWNVFVVSKATAEHDAVRNYLRDRRGQFHIFLSVDSLDEMANKLQRIGRTGKIGRLYLMGHGVAEGEAIAFSEKGRTIDLVAEDFLILKQRHPRLSENFVRGAQVTLESCHAGRNSRLVAAVGNALLGTHGGSVQASTAAVNYFTNFLRGSDRALTYLETPEGRRPSGKPNPWKNTAIPAGGRQLPRATRDSFSSNSGFSNESLNRPPTIRLTNEDFFNN